MWESISLYSVNWRAKTNSGVIDLIFENGTTERIKIDTAQELSTMVDLLRNEKPVYFHTGSKELVTGWEPLGEEERRAGPSWLINP
ncbi:MAG: hypothetical protein ABI851_07720 [Saprospiraceae bacterium]